MSTIIIIGSILIIFGHSEVYGQIMASTADGGDGGSKTTRSDIIDCLVNTCINPNFQLPSKYGQYI
jgi:hypothetical protein